MRWRSLVRALAGGTLLLPVADAASAQSQSPSPSPLERRITLHARDVALRDALDRVAAAGAFRLAYSGDDLPLDRRVTVWRDTSLVRDVLVELLQPFAVTPVALGGDQIVLAPSVREAPDSVTRPATVLDRIVVTGSVVGAAERSLPVAIDVIRGRDIERQGQSTLAAAFDGSLPGLWVWELAPTTMLARYGSIRGASSFGTSSPKVYVDGIEAANPLLLTQLTPELIERIEVIRGPQGAALYGSDAISGVVNIVSRHDLDASDGAHLYLRSAGGIASAYPTASVGVQQHMLSGRVGSNLRSAGASVGASTTGAYVPEAYSREVRVAGDARLVGARVTLSAIARYLGKDAGVPVSPLLSANTRVHADSSPQALRMFTLGSTLTVTPNDIWTYSVTSGVDGYMLANVSSETLPIPSFADSSLRDAAGSATRATARASAVARSGTPETLGMTLTFAVEHAALRDRNLRDAGMGGMGPMTRGYVVDRSNNTGFTTQADLAFRNTAYLTAGIREERITRDNGVALSDRLPLLGGALVRDFAGVTVKARLAYGRGIRAPGTSHRARVTEGKRQIENPLLAPEEQRGTEGGMDVLFGRRVGLHVTRFDQLASGLAQAVLIGDTTSSGPGPARAVYQLQNVGEITNRGWEAQATVTLGGASLATALAAVESRVRKLAAGYTGDLRVGDRMLGVPARTLSGTLGWEGRRAQLATTISRASDWINYDRLAIAQCWLAPSTCPDAKNLSGPTLRKYWTGYGGQTRLRVSGSLAVRRGLSLTLTGENLLNHQLGEPDSITIVPGRTITAGIRARF